MAAAETFLLPVGTGFRFCLLHRPPAGTPARAAVVVAPPFAEELNKSRRMIALTARQLADEGCVVLQADGHGCGDSSGDFADATWDDWIEDVVRAQRWLAERFDAPQWIWGVRAGALLACAALREVAAAGLLLWQPIVSGRQHLAAFLRVATAGALLREGAEPASVKSLLARLQSGEHVDVAGYSVAPAVARGLDAARVELPAAFRGRIACLEVTSAGAPTPAVVAAADAWARDGRAVALRAVFGPSFWQTTEIEVAPALIDATAAMLREPAA